MWWLQLHSCSASHYTVPTWSFDPLWFLNDRVNKQNFYPVFFQVLHRPDHFGMRIESWEVYTCLLRITGCDWPSASNSMDQHTYSLIASSVIVELDCIQFDYIHWAELGGTTSGFEHWPLKMWEGFCQCSNHCTRLDIQVIHAINTLLRGNKWLPWVH